MIILLTGENDYRIRQSLNTLLEEAREKQGADAIQRVDGSTLTPDQLPQLLLGTSLFSSEKTVVLSDPGKSKAVWEKIGDIAPEIDDTTTLIIIDSKPDKRTKTFKTLQKHGDVRVHGELSEHDLLQWIQTSARKQGIDIDVSTARYLMQYTGVDQWRLHHDIAKLASLGRPVTNNLIREVIEPEPRASAFEVLDAALAGHQERALTELAILEQSEEPYRFFGLLASQVYAIAICASASGRSAEQIAKDAGIHPFVAKKTLALTRQYDADDVKRLIAQVADCDYKMKTSGTDPWVLMRLTIGAIASRA